MKTRWQWLAEWALRVDKALGGPVTRIDPLDPASQVSMKILQEVRQETAEAAADVMAGYIRPDLLAKIRALGDAE